MPCVRACACVRVRVDRRCASQLELSESLLTKADRRLSRNVVYAQSAHICAGTGLAAAHICTGTGLAERVSAPAEAGSAGATHRLCCRGRYQDHGSVLYWLANRATGAQRHEFAAVLDMMSDRDPAMVRARAYMAARAHAYMVARVRACARACVRACAGAPRARRDTTTAQSLLAFGVGAHGGGLCGLCGRCGRWRLPLAAEG